MIRLTRPVNPCRQTSLLYQFWKACFVMIWTVYYWGVCICICTISGIQYISIDMHMVYALFCLLVRYRMSTCISVSAIQITKTFGSTLIKYRSDAKASDRRVINIDPRVFVIWVLLHQGPDSMKKVTLHQNKIGGSKHQSVQNTKRVHISYGIYCMLRYTLSYLDISKIS